MRHLSSFLKLIAVSKLSILGAILTTSAIIFNLSLVIGDMFFFESNAYESLFIYMLMPGAVVGGLLLIPVAIVWKAHRVGARSIGEALSLFPEVSLKHAIWVVLGLTGVNLLFFAVVGYQGFHFTESKEFCGTMCHQVMSPEYTAYLRSAHSEVACAECHIGSGASWFVKSKLDGSRQLLAVALGSYSQPIATPVHNLRPARDVCEVCHRPERFDGDLIKVIEHFEPDEENTHTYTILNLRVGGGGDTDRGAHGIHWHVSRDQHVRYYAADSKRQDIVWVELKSADGTRRVWRRPGAAPPDEEIDPDSLRLMDCVDCHNRTGHGFLPPDTALDEWMADGLIDSSIPWIRKLSEELLTRSYETREEAMTAIAELPGIYRERHPEHWAEHGDKLDAVVPSLQEIHSLFVFPGMKIDWNTYPSHIGHPTPQTPGCFRCHDGILADEQGETITNDCEPCHFVLADKVKDPLVLRMLEDR